MPLLRGAAMPCRCYVFFSLIRDIRSPYYVIRRLLPYTRCRARHCCSHAASPLDAAIVTPLLPPSLPLLFVRLMLITLRLLFAADA